MSSFLRSAFDFVTSTRPFTTAARAFEAVRGFFTRDPEPENIGESEFSVPVAEVDEGRLYRNAISRASRRLASREVEEVTFRAPVSDEEAIEMLETLTRLIADNPERRFLLQRGSTVWTLTRQNLLNAMNRRRFEIIEMENESDPVSVALETDPEAENKVITLTEVPRPRFRRRDGAFLPFTHRFGKDVDLSDIQVYREDQLTPEVIRHINTTQCFVNSLEKLDAPEELVRFVKEHGFVSTGTINSSSGIGKCLKAYNASRTCDEDKVFVSLVTICEDTKKKAYSNHPTNFSPTYRQFKIVLFRGHYMPNIQTKYYRPHIQHGFPADVKWCKKDRNKVMRGYAEIPPSMKNSVHPMTVAEIFHVVLTKERERPGSVLTPIGNNVFSKLLYDPVVEVERDEDLDTVYSECTMERAKRQDKTFDAIVFADTETFKLDHGASEPVQTPYQCAYAESSDERVTVFEDTACVRDMMHHLEKRFRDKHVLLYFHNAGFDYAFVARCPGISGIRLCTMGNKLYQACFTLGDTSFTVKCTYMLTGQSLRDWCGSMKVPVSKGVFPYDAMREEVLKQPMVPVKECLANLHTPGEREEFLASIPDREAKKVDLLSYSREYLVRDVESMRACFDVYRTKCLETFDLDVTRVLTAASTAHTVAVEKGAYDDIAQIHGGLRKYVQKSVQGGRTTSAFGRKHDVTGAILDWDAVSLYPTAMSQLPLPRGEAEKMSPKDVRCMNSDKPIPHRFQRIDPATDKPVLTAKRRVTDPNTGKTTFEAWPNEWSQRWTPVSAVFVTVRFDRDLPERAFPVIGVKSDDGGLSYGSAVRGKEMVLNQIQLADLREHCGMVPGRDYTVLRGVTWSRGVCDRMSELIREIFQARKRCKMNGDSTQAILKLILNSIYGKTLQNSNDTVVHVYTTRRDFETAVFNGYNSVRHATEVKRDDGSVYWVVHKNASNGEYRHRSMAHVGSLILAQSKRIMNRMMACLPIDPKTGSIPCWYTDTDSTQIAAWALPHLEKSYRERYGVELTGDDMGQFHDDIAPEKGYDSVVAVRSIILGKKSYLLILRHTNTETGATKRDVHVRMKGIPGRVVHKHADTHCLGEDHAARVEVLYERLLAGERVEFDLLCAGGVSMKTGRDFQIRCERKFTRSVHFPGSVCVTAS